MWFTGGPLFTAIRASMSIPLLFTPYGHEGVDYVDGGVLNPVPVTPTLGDDSDLTVAVHFAGTSAAPRQSPGETPAASLLPGTLQERIRQFMQKLQSPEQKSTLGEADTPRHEWGSYEVAIQSYEAMQNAIAQQKLAANPPDVLIELPRNICRTMEYDRAEELIALGYEAAARTFERSA